MPRQDPVAQLFETHRDRLRAVAYRMLGSLSEADDAVQETWLRLRRVDADEIENLAGWLTTVVSRLCLDQLRSRHSRKEDLVAPDLAELSWTPETSNGPEQEAVLLDSVGRALLVVLDALGPAERVAFVLHDAFGVPFDQIAPVVGRTPVAAKKLASRARRRIQGTPTVPAADLARHREIVVAFLAAARGGDLNALLDVLAPGVVRTTDPAVLPAGAPAQVRGADAVARHTVGLGARSRFAEPALVDGAVGVVLAPRGRLLIVLTVAVEGDRIIGYDVIADPARLAALELALLPG